MYVSYQALHFELIFARALYFVESWNEPNTILLLPSPFIQRGSDKCGWHGFFPLSISYFTPSHPNFSLHNSYTNMPSNPYPYHLSLPLSLFFTFLSLSYSLSLDKLHRFKTRVITSGLFCFTFYCRLNFNQQSHNPSIEKEKRAHT